MGAVAGLAISPPLSAQAERDLLPVISEGRGAARRLDRGVGDERERRRLQRKVRAGREAEALLLQSTFGLVRRRVMERGYRLGEEDLEAAGVEALVHALARFDATKGTRFSTYAYPWITKLVNQSIRQQAGLSESDMVLVLALQRLLRSDLRHKFSSKEIAEQLGITLEKAREVVVLNQRLVNRSFEAEELDAVPEPSRVRHDEAPAWVIDELKKLTGKDFQDFWLYAHGTMSLEEIANQRGISRQAMTKRIEKCRRAVRDSEQAQRLQAWLDRQ